MSINVLAIIVLGGMGSIRGVFVGSAILVGLPELLREFAEYRLLITASCSYDQMLLVLEGLIPSPNSASSFTMRNHRSNRSWIPWRRSPSPLI